MTLRKAGVPAAWEGEAGERRGGQLLRRLGRPLGPDSLRPSEAPQGMLSLTQEEGICSSDAVTQVGFAVWWQSLG